MDPQTTQPESLNPVQTSTQPLNTANSPVEQTEKKKSNYVSIAIAGVLLLILLGLIGYFAYTFLKPSEKKESSGNSTINSTSTQSSTSGNSTTVGTSTAEIDPYEGWKTYTNDLIGYTVKYPGDYILSFRNGDDERCIYLKKETISLNIGRESNLLTESLMDSCFRTGVGAYEIDYSAKNYTINSEDYNIDEWYEKTSSDNGTYGIVYGVIFLDDYAPDIEWGLEYWGTPKETFETERDTVTKIIESITW